MSTLVANAGARGSGSTSTLRVDIQGAWGRFSADEVSALRNRDDLALNLSKKYRLDHYQASQIVEAFADGRKL